MWWWPKPRRRGEDCENRSWRVSDRIRLKRKERHREREREKVDAIGTIAAMMILRSSDSGRAVFAVEPEWIDC